MNEELLTMVERGVLSWPGVTDHPGILQPAGETATIGGGN
jgi:hypothetical protein